MIPSQRTFANRECVEEDGRMYYRYYKIEKQGRFRLKIRVISINSPYFRGIAFSLSSSPKFKGTLLLNEQKFKLDRKQFVYVMPVSLPDRNEIVMDFDVAEGHILLSNASDFLDDYPELIEKVSAQTGRTREQFRGCTYVSGIAPGFLYGNAFWLEKLSDDLYRFHCNDHKMDDDFDDMIFELEIGDLFEK